MVSCPAARKIEDAARAIARHLGVPPTAPASGRSCTPSIGVGIGTYFNFDFAQHL